MIYFTTKLETKTFQIDIAPCEVIFLKTYFKVS